MAAMSSATSKRGSTTAQHDARVDDARAAVAARLSLARTGDESVQAG